MTRAKNKIIKSFFKKIGHREHTNDLFFWHIQYYYKDLDDSNHTLKDFQTRLWLTLN